MLDRVDIAYFVKHKKCNTYIIIEQVDDKNHKSLGWKQILDLQKPCQFGSGNAINLSWKAIKTIEGPDIGTR